jgi:hypothetical protein
VLGGVWECHTPTKGGGLGLLKSKPPLLNHLRFAYANLSKLKHIQVGVSKKGEVSLAYLVTKKRRQKYVSRLQKYILKNTLIFRFS